MQYPLYATVRAGREYSKTWPAKAELNGIFIENKVILLTKLTAKVMPLLSLLCAVAQYSYLGEAFLPQILAMMLFMAALPLQGWYWLGVRAETAMPPAVASWYLQIREKMVQRNVVVAPANQPARYKDLALVLQQAYQQLDKAFIKQWL